MKYRIFPAVDGKTELEVDTSLILGKGAQANIYRCYLDGKVYAAKLFHKSAPISAKKIEQMIANPPDRTVGITAGREYPRYSWPIAVIQGAQGQTVGFLMPLIDLKESFTLDFYYDKTLIKSLGSADEVALSYKIEIAANLSSLISDLHSHGHYFIDFKPQNIRVFKRTHAVTLIDCDGFSINGIDGNRYPADLYSADYICPEAITHSTPASKLGLEQDRYALAVIIFQLLNNGIHPYQGILSNAAENAPTNDDKAAKGLYPHGLISDSRISPRKQSIHHLIDGETRKLFDRAFTMPPELRPAASEWACHLNDLLLKRILSVCDKHPFDVRHMRFDKLDCPECYIQSLKLSAVQSKPTPVQTPSTNFSQTTQSVGNSASQGSFWKEYLSYIVVALVLFFGVVFTFGAKKNAEPSKKSAQPQYSQPATQNIVGVAPNGSEYVSVSVSNNGHTGMHGATTKDESIRMANESCRYFQGTNCSVVFSELLFTGQCVAVSIGLNGAWGVDFSYNSRQAREKARSECSKHGQGCRTSESAVICK